MNRLMPRYHGRVRVYDLLIAVAVLSLAAALVPQDVYLMLFGVLAIRLDSSRAQAMIAQIRWYFPILALVAFASWMGVRMLASEVAAHFRMDSRIISILLQVHFLVFVPTVAFWLYYIGFRVSATASQWTEELKVVPWHHDLPEVAKRIREQIPEDAAILLILEQPGTISYSGYLNTMLYPRKVYMYRRESGRGRISRADVDVDAARKAGITWIVTYSGPRDFDGNLLRVEPVH